MRTVIHLVRIEWVNRWRNKTLPLTIFALIFLYGTSFGMNVVNYQESLQRLQIDPAEGFFFRVPLEGAMKNFSYFSNYAPYEFPFAGQKDSRTGLLLLPDRLEEPGITTRLGRWYFLVMALIILLFAHRERVGQEQRKRHSNLMAGPVRTWQILLSKLLMGVALAGTVFLLETLLVGAISAVADLNLSWAQYLQILLYNVCMAAMMLFMYGLALALPGGRSDGGMALLQMILFLLAMVYIVPAFLDSFRELIYSQLPRGWRAEWYWYSRYLQGLDLFGSYSDLTSDLLFPGRARVLYASLPWTADLAGAEPLTMGRVLMIQWYRWVTMMVWVITVYFIVGRRLRESNVV